MAAAVRLRTTQLDKFFRLRGVTTDDARARAVGVNPATYSRVVRGLAAPGERFIAGTLNAFRDIPEITFEDLFSVVDDADEPVSA